MPVDHVIRELVPWRKDLPAKTECGRDLANIPGDAMTHAEYYQIATDWNATLREFEKADMAIPATIRRPNVCGNCWCEMTGFSSWERDPIRWLRRNLERFGYYPNGPDADRMGQELWALARLADRHRAEFNTLVREAQSGYRRDEVEV